MRPADYPWPNTSLARSVLFAAQVMREAIDVDSYESFRALSLDALARFSEADRLASDIKNQHVPRATLDPIIEELTWSFGEDPALKALCSGEAQLASSIVSDASSSLTQIQYQLRHLVHKIKERYKEHLEEEILRRVSLSETTADLRLLLSGYVTHLVNVGYSRGYISSQIESIFFDRLLLRTGPAILSGFFKRFSGQDSKYVVAVGLNRVMFRHLRNINLRVEQAADSLPTFVADELTRKLASDHQAGFVHEAFDSLDPYSAAKRIQSLLKSLKSIATMAGAPGILDWSQEVFVYKQKAQGGEFVIDEALFDRRSTLSNPRSRALKSAGQYSKKLLNFPMDSRMRLSRSIGTAVASHEASSVEGRLTAYWNAIEVLFEAPDPGRARILHYADLLTPCVCAKYPRRMIAAVFSTLVVSYRTKLIKLLNRADFSSAGDQHTALAFVLMLPQHENARSDLLSIVTDNPLACHRLWRLHKAFGTPEAMTKAVASHEKRIRWQVHRIYRARNGIMHAGRSPSYLDSLAINISEYYRTAVGALISAAEAGREGVGVDQLAADVGIEYRLLLGRLAAMKKEPWTEARRMDTVAP